MTKELNLETIHKDLKRFIIESGQTQKQFAEKMGIPPANLAVLLSSVIYQVSPAATVTVAVGATGGGGSEPASPQSVSVISIS